MLAAEVVAGGATPDGTGRFAARFEQAVAEGHFRDAAGWNVSSVGLGTYPGGDDDTTDRRYARVMTRAISLGCNVFDTAVAYRNQRSERVLGATLSELQARGEIRRDEIVVASKAGFLPFDSASSRSVLDYAFDTFIGTRIVSGHDLVAGRHCLAPRFLRHQIETSRRNLRCTTIDLYALHNPETQLREIPRSEFRRRLRAAFEVLEDAVSEGTIQAYGVSAWSGFRADAGAPDALSLGELVGCARDVAGDAHRFRSVMTPLSLAMPEAALLRSQRARGRSCTLLAAAEEHGVHVLAASSLHQGRLAREPAGGESSAAAAVQFSRSAPGVTTAFVGTTNPRHLEEDLSVARLPALAWGEFASRLAALGRRETVHV